VTGNRAVDIVTAEELGGAMTDKLAELFSETAAPKPMARQPMKKRARA
jgi:cobaltochelatase CobT